jgi:PKD repeat protein
MDGSWANYTLDNSSYAGMFSSIALDEQDDLHISYLDYWDLDNSVLNYATNETGAWEYYSIEVVGTAGYMTSLALDSNGLVHLGYKDSVNNDLRYAFGTERNIPALVAEFVAAPATGQPELTVQFTSNVSGGVQPYTYSWTFGDGGANSSGNPVHAYATEGTYTVTLVVSDLISSPISVQETIEVTAGNVEPVPEDDGLDLMLVFAVVPIAALAVTLVIAGIASRKRKAVVERASMTSGSKDTAAQTGAVDLAAPAEQKPTPVGLQLTSVEQRLFKLKEMRRKGLISEQEYDEKTDELLKKW